MKRLLRLAIGGMLFVPAVLMADHHVDTLDANRWLFPLTDYGPCGCGANWGLPSYAYLFGNGPWLGAVTFDTFVSVGYNPNSGASEFQTGDGQADTLSMVYIWPERWPPPGRFPHAPQVRRSDQDAWCCFNDFDTAGHVPPGRPLGAQVYLTLYEWKGDRAQDLVVLQYEFEAATESTLSTACYAGVALDPDIGSGADDLCGLIYHQWVHRSPSDSFFVDHVAYAYDGYDSGEYVGVALIKTPDNHSATAIKKFTIDVDPVTDAEQFLMMAGYDYRTGIYDPIDSGSLAPGDVRFLVASGPFTLGFPGPTLETLAVVIGAATNLTDLAEIGIIGESLYLNGVPGISERPAALGRASRPKAWPNPFVDEVWFESAKARTTNVDIRDVSGRLVWTLAVSGRGQWRGDDSRGSQVVPGVYFVSVGGQRLKIVRR
jgi:hypothetical protein